MYRTAPEHKLTKHLQNRPRRGGRQLDYCCQSTAAATEASPGAFGGLFGCSQHTKSKAGRKKYFFCEKRGIWGHNRGPPYAHFFYTKNLFSAQLDFPPPRTAKKAPKPTWACFRCRSSALATVFQLPQLWTPICPFFFTKKIFFRPSLIFRRQEQPKRRPKPPGLASIATAVLWQQYFNCHNRGRIERN